MEAHQHIDAAVIGAGASGLLVARAAVRRGLRVELIERDPCWRPGRAYATTDPHHLLNVRASCLGVDADDPNDFTRWAQAQLEEGVEGDAFLPRRMYGEYLRRRVAEVECANGVRFVNRISGGVRELVLDEHGVCITVDSGRVRAARHVVLALGNPPPRRLARARTPGVIEDPWETGALDAVEPGDRVLLVGSGLTAVDVALVLAARGVEPIAMISRHGLLPSRHAERSSAGGPVDTRAIGAARTARELVHAFRCAATDAGDARAVVDAMRATTNDIWRALPECERARLVRHVLHRWDRWRHRMPPEAACAVDALVGDGRLVLIRGCVTTVAPGRCASVRVGVRHGDTADTGLDAEWVVNCTGPDYCLRHSDDPLVHDLLTLGIARCGGLGLGLDATRDGRLVAGDGRVHPNAWAIGPIRRGSEWETTAIPEIRAQAAAIVNAIGNSLL